MTAPAGHSGCRDVLTRMIAALSDDLGAVEVTISTAAPIIASPYGVHGYKCPHGTTYWIEPTSEQIAKWRREGVA